jgi:hypothetical protein
MKISPPNTLSPAPCRIGIIAFPESQILDISGPLAVFSEACRQFRAHTEGTLAAYEVELI